jgi:hypothetical protein
MRLEIDAAFTALTRGTVCNGYLLLGLQWLALNRGRFVAIVR